MSGSGLDGLIRFGAAALQGYQGEIKSLEEKKRLEDERLLQEQRLRRQDERLNAQEMRSQQSHDLNMRQTQAALDRTSIVQGREDDEYKRKRTLESGLGQAQAAAEIGDAAGVFSALESTSNSILDVQMKFDRDANGKIIVDSQGKATGQRFSKDGVPIGAKAQYDMDKSTQALAALSDPASYWQKREQNRLEIEREARADKSSRSNFLFQNRITRQQKIEDDQRQEQQDYRKKITDGVIDLLFKEPKTTTTGSSSALYGGFDSKGNVVGSALDPSIGGGISPQVASSIDTGLQRAQQLMQAMPQLFDGNPYLKKLVEANIAVESGGNPNAKSPAGARGLMQIMPIARQDVMQRGAPDPYASPQNNVIGGTVQLDRLIQKYNGDLAKAFAANNWGEGNVDKLVKANPAGWQNGLPAETKAHLAKLDYALKANGLSLAGATEAQQQQIQRQRQANRVQSANMASAKIPDVSKRVVEDLGIGKATRGRNQLTGADVNARLTKAVEYISDLQMMPAGSNETARYEKFRQAAQEIAEFVPATMKPEQRSSYILGVMAQLVNARSIEEMRQKLRLVNPEGAGQAQAAPTPKETAASVRRGQAPVADNPYMAQPNAGGAALPQLGLPVGKGADLSRFNDVLEGQKSPATTPAPNTARAAPTPTPAPVPAQPPKQVIDGIQRGSAVIGQKFSVQPNVTQAILPKGGFNMGVPQIGVSGANPTIAQGIPKEPAPVSQPVKPAKEKNMELATRIHDDLYVGGNSGGVTIADVDRRLKKSEKHLSELQDIPATKGNERYKKFRKAALEIARLVPESMDDQQKTDYVLGVMTNLLNVESVDELRKKLNLVKPTEPATPKETIGKIQRKQPAAGSYSIQPSATEAILPKGGFNMVMPQVINPTDAGNVVDLGKFSDMGI